jgi:hypothetical protein
MPEETAVTAPAETKPSKPGYKTSEFWLSSAAVVMSQLYASGVIGDSSAVGKVAALVVSILGALGYTVMRAKAKA